MPRAWLTRLLFALALAVQVIAPMASNVAAAREGGSDDGVGFCVKAGGQTEHRTPGHAQDGRDCPICQTLCDGVAPIAARPSAPGMAPVQWVEVPWTVADRVLPVLSSDGANRARAPPIFS
jgi:hypothetical protein